MFNHPNILSALIAVVATTTFAWTVSRFEKRIRLRRYTELPIEERNTQLILLAPHRIASVGLLLLTVGAIGCIGSIIMLIQNLDLQKPLFWPAVALTLLMLAIVYYGRHLYLIREKVVQLYLGRSGLYYMDLKISTVRRPFWAILENKKFLFQAYQSIEAVKLVESFTGTGIVIETLTGGFTLPIYIDNQQDVISLAGLIKSHANLQ